MNGVGSDAHFAGIHSPDPFAHSGRFWSKLINAILATALFRCWHILIFFGGWSATIACINGLTRHKLVIQPTLLTVLGTVLGFVISYRTTSSFERYNEGRRYWSQIILASRTFARLVWFHVPETMAIGTESMSADEKKARVIVEKKTVINLIEAFSVAVKHYLRGEEGIDYVDLYHLVKCLPTYALPAGLPSAVDLNDIPMSPKSPSTKSPSVQRRPSDIRSITSRRTSISHPNIRSSESGQRPRSQPPPPMPTIPSSVSAPHLPMPVTSLAVKPSFLEPIKIRTSMSQSAPRSGKDSIYGEDLLPARMPPKYHLFDLFPFSLLVKMLTKRGKEVKGKKGARLRAKLRNRATTHNLPLEISLYLSSYIAALQARKALDPPTITLLISTLNQLVDALTGLERILTTPIPFSYSVHLWAVTIVYCLALPFQLWSTLRWVTIPGTTVASFIFFGFLVAGEEIENPFGYDKNDLNMDHFTHNIIRNELRAITAAPAPNPADWAFASSNDHVFADRSEHPERVSPEEWVQRGLGRIQDALLVG
ncbi:hypothetical protein EW146_g2985 [Bondarzewia mesenterica]|uniref:Uncharacterized protein n=1 Tax=Bondarzewia mesenterica TaxID=1095465 RepID=A0A4S4M4W9_9AGAM|nr:hypothetical protein EW146_g2985 [Bondarzewia mesenterica]